VVPGIFLGWQMRDSNPRRRCQLIYSQPPLAARVICRTSKEDHFRRPFLLDPVTEGRDNLTEVFAKNLIGSRRPGIRRISGFPRIRPASLASNFSACSVVIWLSCTARSKSACTPSIREAASGTGLKTIEAATAAAATALAAATAAVPMEPAAADAVLLMDWTALLLMLILRGCVLPTGTTLTGQPQFQPCMRCERTVKELPGPNPRLPY
jgi:hypothetical protein